MVNFLPSSKQTTELIIKEADLSKEDIIYDLGSGDGRIVIGLRKVGYKAFGIEKNEELYNISVENAQKEGFENIMIMADVLDYDFLDADVIIIYQGNNFIEKIGWRLERISKIISIGAFVPNLKDKLIKTIPNKVQHLCHSINFYGDYEDFKKSTIEEIMRNSNSFIEARNPKEADETIYIHESK